MRINGGNVARHHMGCLELESLILDCTLMGVAAIGRLPTHMGVAAIGRLPQMSGRFSIRKVSLKRALFSKRDLMSDEDCRCAVAFRAEPFHTDRRSGRRVTACVFADSAWHAGVQDASVHGTQTRNDNNPDVSGNNRSLQRQRCLMPWFHTGVRNGFLFKRHKCADCICGRK